MFCELSKHWGGVAAVLLFACVAVAQQKPNPQPSGGEAYSPGTFYPPYYGGGGGYYGGGYGRYGGFGAWGGVGGTVAGNYLQGMGSAIRAQGQYNLDTSAAAINLEAARTRSIENQKLWTQTYFEKREINRAYREKERGPRESPSAWVRAAQDAAPDRLPPSELDPVTGRIGWPPGLMGDDFASDRQKLDQAFAQRALARGAIGVNAHAEIRTALNDMLDKLKANIRRYDPSKYLASRNFLTSLAYEATLPTTGPSSGTAASATAG